MEIYKCIPPDSTIGFYLPISYTEQKLVYGKIVKNIHEYKYCIKGINDNNFYYITYKENWDVMYSVKVGYYVITDKLIENYMMLEGIVTAIKDDLYTIETLNGYGSHKVEMGNSWKVIYPSEIGKVLIKQRENEYEDYIITSDDDAIDLLLELK